MSGQELVDALPSPAAGPSHFRGHLFSDLRGYTSFIERAGNAAGAELLHRYRDVVRAQVDKFGGAEIKTEGDAFYVVFPSASSAVMCGLAITEAAEEANQAHPDAPIRVGVGVHAGEAVEAAGTYVGTAVNLAARVCSVAEAGEVLVTGTVRSIAQASIPVSYAPRGRRRLKGISDPVELYTVVPAGAPMPARRRVPGRVAGLAAVGIATLAMAGVAFVAWPRSEAPSLKGTEPPASAAPATEGPRVAQIGALALGEYDSGSFEPAIHFAISDPGWSLYRDTTEVLGFFYEADPKGRLDIGRIGRVLTDACSAEGPNVVAGETPEDLLEALGQVTYLHLDEPGTVTVGGHQARSVDFTVDPGAQAACGSFGTEGIAIFPIGEEIWHAQAGETARLVAVDLGDQTISMLMSGEQAPEVSVTALEDFFAHATRIVDSMRL